MPDGDRRVSATRSVYLELSEELRLVRDGYEFLDEKRIILADRMMRLLREYVELDNAFRRRYREAGESLAASVGRHGLDGLSVYPATLAKDASLAQKIEQFVGLELVTAKLDGLEKPHQAPAVNPSPEAGTCAESFRNVMRLAAQFGAVCLSLRRLIREYRRTERRARALENVVLPELKQSLATVSEYLELLEQEDAVRVRWVAQANPVGVGKA